MDPVTLTLLGAAALAATGVWATRKQNERSSRPLGPPDAHGLVPLEDGWARAGSDVGRAVARRVDGSLVVSVDAPRVVATTKRLGARLERDIVRGAFGEATPPFGTFDGGAEHKLLAADEILGGAPAVAVAAFAASEDVKAAVSAVLGKGGSFFVSTSAVVFAFKLPAGPLAAPAVREALDLAVAAARALEEVARLLPLLDEEPSSQGSTAPSSGVPFAVPLGQSAREGVAPRQSLRVSPSAPRRGRGSEP